MKAICADGTEIECENFKAIDSGVLLTKDRKRKQVIGFVPNNDLRYVVPEGVETKHEHGRDAETRSSRRERSEDGRELLERERGGDREELAALRERLDRLEARVDLSTADDTGRAGRSAATVTTEKRRRDAGAGREDESDRRAGDGTGGSDREASEDRTTASTAGTNIDGETEPVETSGFDPVAIVAEQREHGAEPDRSGRDTSETETDTATIDIGRSDPIATIARQGSESTAEESGGKRSASDAEDTEGGEDIDREDESETDAELQRVDGLGPTYADRLRSADIETLTDLEAAAPEDVASIAEVSESRAGEWIEQAGELTA